MDIRTTVREIEAEVRKLATSKDEQIAILSGAQWMAVGDDYNLAVLTLVKRRIISKPYGGNADSDELDALTAPTRRKPRRPRKSNRKPRGTAPDTSLHLGDERRAWLKANGGLQPTINRLVDAAMQATGE